ncbi:FusB/FusC family EF-G-binding protein [Bacillus sp. AK031]
MEPFIRNDQFNYIKVQTKNLVNGHSSASDPGVLKAVKAMVKENVTGLFSGLSPAQSDLLDPVDMIKDKQDAEVFLAQLKPFVIPFRRISEKTLEKLFPKVKKLKLPDLANMDFREITYLGWNDIG